ncbi:MAG: MBOAT family protein, partial [Flavobacteriales bacterium]|nr:MBOAT family protein [Flavobacteriales bacterium]
MLFNSIEFLLFFVAILFFYYALPHKYRWVLLLGGSYFFYGYWKASYLLLIMSSTILDFFIGQQIFLSSSKSVKKLLLYLSLATNLSVLILFKYFDFFITNISVLLSQANINCELYPLELILPIGISFYTFQTLSYSIDIYNGKIKQPEKHLGKFALFVSFFPQLVAGPIERASHLLPQFHKKQHFDYEQIKKGLTLMLWGFFKKIVIADRLAIFVNEIYGTPTEYHGLTLVTATIFFAFQINCDFSGYSDIAIGAARTMGFDLMKNFRTPYFSASISEFWSRWHISLSTWFRDYVYIPLGGNRTVKWKWYYNLILTFLISGFWHGANWTFIIWGLLHGTLLVIQNFKFLLINSNNNFIKMIKIANTFTLVCIGWIYFRANSLSDANYIVGEVFDVMQYKINQLSLYIVPVSKSTVYSIDILLSILTIIVLVLTEYIFTKKIEFHQLSSKIKLPILVIVILSIFIFGSFEK